MPEALLTADQVSRVFTTGAGDVHALTDVSMDVAAGELVVVRGPSGSGKTTLLNLLGGLDRPTSGRVLLGDGRELSALPEKDVLEVRRTQIGYVFQSFGLIPVLSAAENVEIPLRLLEVDPAEREERVAAALELVGLAGHAKQRPYELSGGQQQRVGIARALVGDEDAGLGSKTAATIMELIQDLTHARDLAAVVSTHDPVLMQRADRVVELHDGALVPA